MSKVESILVRYYVEPDGDGFMAWAPGLSGCRTWGLTQDEARENIIEVIGMHLEIYVEDGEPIPYGQHVISESDFAKDKSSPRRRDIVIKEKDLRLEALAFC